MTNNNDRWFRMCKDAMQYLGQSVFHMDTFLETHVIHHNCRCNSIAGMCVSSWTVDELMGLYSWIKPIEAYKPPNQFLIHQMMDGRFIYGESFNDCWLQLVMWDKFQMVWNDKESRWCKE